MEEDIKELENYIAGLPRVIHPARQGAVSGNSASRYIFLACLLLLAVAGLVVLLRRVLKS